MSTFYNPETIRRLAASGDKFFAGAAWVLDQQAAQAEAREEALEAGLARMAARVDETDYDSEWTPVRNRAGQAYPTPTGSSIDEMRNMVRAVRNAADLGAPRVP